jgi:hypothetical protein
MSMVNQTVRAVNSSANGLDGADMDSTHAPGGPNRAPSFPTWKTTFA